MPLKLKIRNCFVSYHHEYDQEYITKLRKITKKMKVYDHSLKTDIGNPPVQSDMPSFKSAKGGAVR